MENKQILSEIIVQILGFGVVFLILKNFAWGKLLGALDARRKKIEDAFFDRGGYLYHGRIQALADGLREAGVKF